MITLNFVFTWLLILIPSILKVKRSHYFNKHSYHDIVSIMTKYPENLKIHQAGLRVNIKDVQYEKDGLSD